MAVPKGKVSRRRRDKRRSSHWKLTAPNLVACPKCGKDVVIKMTKKGRRYYGCIDNPECDFMSWGRPVAKKCPRCGGYMVEKGAKLACADEHCGYTEAKESKNEK